MAKKVNTLLVSYVGASKKIAMGRLAIKDRKIFFEFSQQFLQANLELSPFKLPVKPGVIFCQDRIFDGLFGVFNDSLPDGWGRQLLDRKLFKLGIKADELTPLDRLCYVGKKGMGALTYEPEFATTTLNESHDLDQIANECFEFQEHDEDRFVDELLQLNGSSAGARPQILYNQLNKNGEKENWVIKFRSSSDPKDIGPIEYAYHLMAKASGLEVPESKLFKSKKSPGYFGVKRFDRVGERAVHMHSLSGLLHVDFRIQSLDYETLIKTTLWLTKDRREAEKQFRNSVFNVLAHNRDDHAKNFSFLMDEAGTWRVAPAYDLTYSSGPAGEHCMTIMGEGKNPTYEHLIKLAELADIKKKKAAEMIDKVKGVIAKWKIFAERAGVSPLSRNKIGRSLGS